MPSTNLTCQILLWFCLLMKLIQLVDIFDETYLFWGMFSIVRLTYGTYSFLQWFNMLNRNLFQIHSGFGHICENVRYSQFILIEDCITLNKLLRMGVFVLLDKFIESDIRNDWRKTTPALR